jgi:hypothetical protein
MAVVFANYNNKWVAHEKDSKPYSTIARKLENLLGDVRTLNASQAILFEVKVDHFGLKEALKNCYVAKNAHAPDGRRDIPLGPKSLHRMHEEHISLHFFPACERQNRRD